MWTQRKSAESLPCCLHFVSPSSGKRTELGAEIRSGGYIRDENGKLLRGVRVTVNRESYQTQAQSDVIPQIIPHTAVGAIVFDDPNFVESREITGHAATTDTIGHYSFKGLAAGQYALWASPTQRNFDRLG